MEGQFSDYGFLVSQPSRLSSPVVARSCACRAQRRELSFTPRQLGDLTFPSPAH